MQAACRLAGITQTGSFSYNRAFSAGEIDEMVSEYRGTIEAQKLEKLHAMHRDTIGGDLIRRDLLINKTIILVSDGLSSGFSLDLAMEYLKPVASERVIMAAPFASVRAVDRMHVLADDLFCLNVLEDFFSVDHYYDTNDVPAHELVLKAVARIVAEWTAPTAAEVHSMEPCPDVGSEPAATGKLAALRAKFRNPNIPLPTRRRFTVDSRGDG